MVIDDARGENFFLSLFYRMDSPIVISDLQGGQVKCETAMKAFQLLRLTEPKGLSIYGWYDNAASIQRAFSGKNCRYNLRENWESIMYRVMEKVLLARFNPSKNPRECELLKATYPNEIDLKSYHIYKYDDYWFKDFEGKGQNNYSKLLMEIREKLIHVKQ